MTARGGGLARAAGFGAITLGFSVTDPLVLIALPLVVLLMADGRLSVRSAILVGALLALAALGDRVGLWWFERGWPLLLGGAFVWVSGARPRWSFSTRALTAVATAALLAVGVFAISPGAWLDLDALMMSRANQAASSMATLLGSRVNEVRDLLTGLTRLQVAIFPALLGMSSVGALGVAAAARNWLAGDPNGAFGRLRNFRFNDHLVWLWLIGLALLLAPAGDIAERVGGNAAVFMGGLYVVRGLAVLLALAGGVPWALGLIGAIIAVLIAPLLILFLVVALFVGVGDTWLDVRRRVRERA